MQKKMKNPAAVQVEQSPVQPEKRRPIHSVKSYCNGGLVSGSVWRNHNEQGKTWLSVSLSRSHKSSSGEWKYGESFTRDELLGLIPVILKLHDYISTVRLEEKNNE